MTKKTKRQYTTQAYNNKQAKYANILKQMKGEKKNGKI